MPQTEPIQANYADYLSALAQHFHAARRQKTETPGAKLAGPHKAQGGYSTTRHSAFAPFEHLTAYPGGPELVVLPPGPFLMGAHPQDRDTSFDEKPRNAVEIKQAFALGHFAHHL
jgi:formylglycine-generating enzyme required for sulfatase activity